MQTTNTITIKTSPASPTGIAMASIIKEAVIGVVAAVVRGVRVVVTSSYTPDKISSKQEKELHIISHS